MANQQDAPQCPHPGHGPMVLSKLPGGKQWQCSVTNCIEGGSILLLNQERQRSRAGEHGPYIAAKRDAEQQRQRAEAAEAKHAALRLGIKQAHDLKTLERPHPQPPGEYTDAELLNGVRNIYCWWRGNTQRANEEQKRREQAEARVREQRDDLLALQTRILEVETERDRLWEALQKIYFKAGSHTITPQAAARGEDDPGFAGIHVVALGALAGPAPHGYCPHHPGVRKHLRPGWGGYTFCPKCEEPNDVNR